MFALHICHVPIPEDHPNLCRVRQNHKRWVLNLAKAQQNHTALRCECVVVVPGSSCIWRAEIEGIKVHYLPASARGRATTLFAQETATASRYVKDLAPDIVHAHGTEESNLLIAQRSGVPYVFTAQGLHFLLRDAVRFPWIGRERIIMLLEHHALKKTPFTIAKSRYVRDRLQQRYPNMALNLIPNTFDPAILLVREPRGDKHLIFVGDITPTKGLDILRNALPTVVGANPDVELHIVGNARRPSRYEREQLERLQALLRNKLHCHGVLSAPNVWRFMAQSVALIAPSREEMFGNQVIEALLLGTHAIVTDQTAMAEHVRLFGNGTVVPQDDPAALATAILASLGGVATQNAAASRAIRLHMDPATVAQKHHAFYGEIASRWKGRTNGLAS